MEYIISLDTNVLCHFGSLRSFDWKSLNPDADNILIVMTPTVIFEMDNHKVSKDNTLKKRSVEFNKYLRAAEENGYTYTVNEGSPTVILKLFPLIDIRELNGEQFNLNDPDSRIVAELSYIKDKFYPDILLISNDVRPLYLANSSGLPCTRTPKEWDRVDEPEDPKLTEAKKEIESLKRQIGPKPILNFMDLEIRRKYPVLLSEEFIKNLERGRRNIVFDQTYFIHSLEESLSFSKFYKREELLILYREKLEEFKILSLEERLLSVLQIASSSTVVPLRFENSGTAHATDIILGMEIKNNGCFKSEAELQRENLWLEPCSKCPVQVKNDYGYPAVSRQRHPHSELINNMKEMSSKKNQVEFFRNKLPHNFHAGALFRIMPDNINESSVIEATLHSKELTEPVNAIHKIIPEPIEITPDNYLDFLGDIAHAMSQRQNELLTYFDLSVGSDL